MIKNDNYICIQGWMCKDLKLKGVKLLIYAIIYGFSQDNNSYFCGSLEYLQQWTNSTKQGVIKALKELLADNLIVKENYHPNNKYYVTKVNDKVNKVDLDSKQSLQNNIDNNIDNNKNNISNDEKEEINSIISYLNTVCGTNYKNSSKSALKNIKARLKDGFSLHDFYTVIEYKYNEWGKNPKKFSNGQLSSVYLRPSTLFGNKMEEYLHQAWITENSEGFENINYNIKSTKKSDERSNKVY